MRIRTKKIDRKGVSPVIGVILMVAATIVIAGVVMAMLGGFSAPKTGYIVTAKASQSPSSNLITVLYNGGPDHSLVNMTANLAIRQDTASRSPSLATTTFWPSMLLHLKMQVGWSIPKPKTSEAPAPTPWISSRQVDQEREPIWFSPPIKCSPRMPSSRMSTETWRILPPVLITS